MKNVFLKSSLTCILIFLVSCSSESTIELNVLDENQISEKIIEHPLNELQFDRTNNANIERIKKWYESKINENLINKNSKFDLDFNNVNSYKIDDKEFKSFIDTIKQNDLVIFNNTKVIKARLFGEKISGGKVEILIEKIINDHLVIGHIGTSKKIKDGLEILVGPAKIRVQSRIDNMFLLSISIDVYQLIDQFGQLPLPPYINRKNN